MAHPAVIASSRLSFEEKFPSVSRWARSLRTTFKSPSPPFSMGEFKLFGEKKKNRYPL